MRLKWRFLCTVSSNTNLTNDRSFYLNKTVVSIEIIFWITPSMKINWFWYPKRQILDGWMFRILTINWSFLSDLCYPYLVNYSILSLLNIPWNIIQMMFAKSEAAPRTFSIPHKRRHHFHFIENPTLNKFLSHILKLSTNSKRKLSFPFLFAKKSWIKQNQTLMKRW